MSNPPWLVEVTLTRTGAGGLTRPWSDITCLRISVDLNAANAPDAGFTAVSAVLSALAAPLPDVFTVTTLEVESGEDDLRPGSSPQPAAAVPAAAG